MSEFPNKNNSNASIEKRARSTEEAISEALGELGIAQDDAVIEIVQEPSKGFLGLGAKEAVVKVSVKGAEAAAETIERSVNTIESEQGSTEAASEEAAEKVSAELKTAASNGVYDSDSPAENAKNFISDILNAMGVEVNVSAVLEDDVVKVELEGENMGIVIGKRGDTLDGIQYLTSLVINRNSEEYTKVSIDTENYREKREAALVSLSSRLAEKVAASGKKFALEPMNPYERRIIHSNLQENPDVTTFSVGQEPYRKVVIAPKRKYGKRSGYGKRNNNRRRNDDGNRGGYRSGYNKSNDRKRDYNKRQDTAAKPAATYKADFKPQQHKAEYKNFEEYLAAHSKD